MKSKPKKVESVFDQFFRFKAEEIEKNNENIEKIPDEDIKSCILYIAF